MLKRTTYRSARLSKRHSQPMTDLTRKSYATFAFIGDGFVDANAIPFYDAQALRDIPAFARHYIQQENPLYNYYTKIDGDSFFKETLRLNAIQHNLPHTENDNILVTAGASNAFSSLCYALCDEGDVILALSPSYILFANAPEAYGAELQLVESQQGIRKFTVLPEKLDQQINENLKAGNTVKAVLIVNPTNIDGQYWTEDEVEEIAIVIEKYGLSVIEDRVYDQIQFDLSAGKPAFFANNKRIQNNVITIDSVSKRYGATQWRIGWIYGPKNIIAAAQKYVMQSVWSPSHAYQKAAAIMMAAQLPEKIINEHCHDVALSAQLVSAQGHSHEMHAYFIELNKSYKRRRDLCLLIVNGRKRYEQMTLSNKNLTSAQSLLNHYKDDLARFSISTHGLQNFETPILPNAAMFLLLALKKCTVCKCKLDEKSADLILARLMYKDANVVMLPHTELTLPEGGQHYFRMEYGVPLEQLLQGLSNLQKFMQEWCALPRDHQAKRIDKLLAEMK